jgi:hypothetical protein
MSNSRTIHHCAAVLVLVAVGTRSMGLAPALAAEDAAFCDRLKEIVNNTANDFASIAVEPIDDATWKASVVLPGQESCYVLRGKTIHYICESNVLDSRDKASALADKRMQQASKCLGPVWQHNTALSEFFSSLNDEENRRSFIIKVDKAISPIDEYVVRIQIARSYQQHLEAPPLTADEIPIGEYCRELTKAVQSGKAFFSDLIAGVTTEATGTRKHWKSVTQFKGWEDCWVHEINNQKACRYLSCSRGPFIDAQESTAMTERVAAESRQCLGQEWSIARTRQMDGTLNLRVLGRTGDPYVEIRPSRSLYSSGWNVKLDVMLDTGDACAP